MFILQLLCFVPIVLCFNPLPLHFLRVKHYNKGTSTSPEYGPFYMEMPLDHFSNDSGIFFNNRYWVNADYYQTGGPIICKSQSL